MESAMLAAHTKTPAPRSTRRTTDVVVRAALVACASFVLVATVAILLFLSRTGIRGIQAVGVRSLLSGDLWKPESETYGGLPLMFGTFTTAAGAVFIGALPAVAAAVWVTELAPKSVRAIYRPT